MVDKAPQQHKGRSATRSLHQDKMPVSSRSELVEWWISLCIPNRSFQEKFGLPSTHIRQLPVLKSLDRVFFQARDLDDLYELRDTLLSQRLIKPCEMTYPQKGGSNVRFYEITDFLVAARIIEENAEAGAFIRDIGLP